MHCGLCSRSACAEYFTNLVTFCTPNVDQSGLDMNVYSAVKTLFPEFLKGMAMSLLCELYHSLCVCVCVCVFAALRGSVRL